MEIVAIIQVSIVVVTTTVLILVPAVLVRNVHEVLVHHVQPILAHPVLIVENPMVPMITIAIETIINDLEQMGLVRHP